MPIAKALVQVIEKLSPAERVRLIDRGVRDTIRPDAEFENIWAKEVAARWNAFERGEVTVVPYEVVMSNYRKTP